VQYSGLSFAANETVSIYWGIDNTGLSEGTATSDASGNLSFSFTVPAGLADGSYPVTIVRTGKKPALITTEFKVFPMTLRAIPGGIRSGQSITVKVTGLLANDGLNIRWDANGGQVIGYLQTNNNGTAKSTFIPPSAPTGTYTLTAIDGHGLQVTGSLNIGPGIAIEGENNVPSGTVLISGGGFNSGETVNLYFQTQSNGIVSAVADSTGAFTAEIKLPATYNLSTKYFIYAVNATGTAHVRTPFQFATPSFDVASWYDYGREVYYGQNEQFFISGFGSGETVNIIWNYQKANQYTFTSAQTDIGGRYYDSLQPPSTPASTVTIAAIGVTSHITIVLTVPNLAGISFDGGSRAGQSLTVTGGNFGSNDTISILLLNTTVASTTSASDGTFSVSFTLPPIQGPGNTTLVAKDTTANISAQMDFYYAPVITFSPSTIHNGDSITVTAANFGANDTMTADLGTDGYGGFTNNQVTTDSNGSFTATLQTEGLNPGTYYICFWGAIMSWCSDTTVTVQ
jgi:hypothetical protein